MDTYGGENDVLMFTLFTFEQHVGLKMRNHCVIGALIGTCDEAGATATCTNASLRYPLLPRVSTNYVQGLTILLDSFGFIDQMPEQGF